MRASATGDDAAAPHHHPDHTPSKVPASSSSRWRPSRFKDFTARRPATAFLILVFTIAYPVMTLVALAEHQVIPGKGLIDRLPIPADELSGLLLTLFALVPAAVYVTWAADGPAGVRQLFRRVTWWRFGLGWWLFLLTALPVLTLAAGLLLGDAFQPPPLTRLLLDQLPLLLVNLLLVNLWEETAWAGVLQTRLEQRHNLFTAAVLTAVPFGFAHWPLAFLDDVTPASALISLAAYILLGILVRPLAALTMRGARDSVLAFALLHSVFNRTNNPNGIAATALEGDAYQIGILAVLILLTLTLAVILRHRLGRRDRHHLDQEAARVPTHHHHDHDRQIR